MKSLYAYSPRNLFLLCLSGLLLASCAKHADSADNNITITENPPSPAASSDAKELPSQTKNQNLAVTGAGKITIDCDCDVDVVSGPTDKISVRIDASPDDINKFDVTQNGNDVTLHQNQPIVGSSGTVIILGNGNSSMEVYGDISGGVNVNGQTIQGNSIIRKRAPHITLTIPDNEENLNLTLSGDSKFKSVASFNNAILDFRGSATVSFATHSVSSFDVEGSVDADLKMLGGVFKADVSGSGDIKAHGDFDSVDVSVSGSGDVNTTGKVKGDYRARVSGSGDINHTGEVGGQITRRVSGSGDISFNP